MSKPARPKHINKVITRHGRTIYYFRRGQNRRIRLPDEYGTPEFWEAYSAALDGHPITPERHDRRIRRKQAVAENRRLDSQVVIKKALRRSESRARQREWEYDLTLEWALGILENNDYRCPMTGIPFMKLCEQRGAMNPFAPSIDRIDTSQGYTQDNTRIVLTAINIMMSDWGEDVMDEVFAGYVRNKKRRGRD